MLMFRYVSIKKICFHVHLAHLMFLFLVILILNHIILSYSFLKVRFIPFLLTFVLVVICVHNNYNVLTTIWNIATTYKVSKKFVYQANLQWNCFYSYKCVGWFLTKANFGTKAITLIIYVVNVLCKHIVVTTKNKPIIWLMKIGNEYWMCCMKSCNEDLIKSWGGWGTCKGLMIVIYGLHYFNCLNVIFNEVIFEHGLVCGYKRRWPLTSVQKRFKIS